MVRKIEENLVLIKSGKKVILYLINYLRLNLTKNEIIFREE
jgi:hypothetical protein